MIHTSEIVVFIEETTVNLEMNPAQEVAGLGHRQEIANRELKTSGSIQVESIHVWEE